MGGQLFSFRAGVIHIFLTAAFLALPFFRVFAIIQFFSFQPFSLSPSPL